MVWVFSQIENYFQPAWKLITFFPFHLKNSRDLTGQSSSYKFVWDANI